MADNSKYNGSTWSTGFTGIRKTATETIQSGDTIYADGTAATVSLKGNTIQNGTPSPSSPVPVLGVGDLVDGNYQIPISNNSTTTPIYLGSVQSNRQIYKLVLTGGANETYTTGGTGDYKFFAMALNPTATRTQSELSTHFPYHLISATADTQIGFSIITSGAEMRFRPENVSNMDVTAWKTWLQQQYANGTPVTFWYVLATPQTTAVNEPLMKIGTYADSISGISLPTIDGANTITVDTTVQPSEVSATWTGWHDSSVKEYDGTDWT